MTSREPTARSPGGCLPEQDPAVPEEVSGAAAARALHRSRAGARDRGANGGTRLQAASVGTRPQAASVGTCLRGVAGISVSTPDARNAVRASCHRTVLATLIVRSARTALEVRSRLPSTLAT